MQNFGRAGNSKQSEQKDFRLYTFVNWTVDGTQIQNPKSKIQSGTGHDGNNFMLKISDLWFFWNPYFTSSMYFFSECNSDQLPTFFTHFSVGATAKQQQSHPKVMTKMAKKCSTDQSFIRKRNTMYL